jgi:ATP-dependent exoDNAse (exonuclease V) alpha subunit
LQTLLTDSDFGSFPGETVTFPADDYFVGSDQFATKCLDKETRLLQELKVKVSMPVIPIQNMDVSLGWVNGTIVTVCEVESQNICLEKERDSVISRYWIQPIRRTVPKTGYTRKQFPIVPTFATTIHKAQSATIDCVAIHLGDMFEHGQLYVAMPRVKAAENLYFFGAELPLKIKRNYVLNWNATEIVILNNKRSKLE